MGVAMVPFTMYLPQGLFVYWVGNGLYSILQVSVLKNQAVKDMLDIPAAPPRGYGEQAGAGTVVEEAEITEPEPGADGARPVEEEQSPMMQLYRENQRLLDANKRLMDRASKGGK